MDLSLNCLVLGDDKKKVFTVKVPDSDNVSILKDLIKGKKTPHLDHLAASDLDLWKVNVNLPLEAAVNLTLDTSDYQMLTSPIAKLSSFFEFTPNDEYIHIIVKAPGTL